MDLKALMQKLETINNTEILTESEKKETTWTDKSGKKHPATQVKGDKYTGKEADKEDKKSKKDDLEENFTSAIAQALVEEFGYQLDERVSIDLKTGATTGNVAPAPADPNNTAAVDANTKKMQADRAAKDGTTNYTSGLDTKPTAAPAAGQAASPATKPAAAPAAVANPYQGADAAKFAALTPQDQAWLTKGGGKPDINDEFILARAPNKGKPATGGQASSPAAAPAAAPTATAAAPTATAAAPTATAAAPTGGLPPGKNEYGEPYDDGTNAPLQEPPGAEPEAGGQAASPAKPAAPAANKSMTPAITAYASRMGLLKNNKPDVDAIKKFQQDNGLKADGIIGPNTAGAIISAQKPNSGGRGAGAPAGQPQGAPANPKAAEIDAQLAKYKKYPQSNAQIIARLEKEKAALTGSQAASPAAPAPAAPTTSGGRPMPAKQEESIVNHDDAILAMIRNIRV